MTTRTTTRKTKNQRKKEMNEKFNLFLELLYQDIPYSTYYTYVENLRYAEDLFICNKLKSNPNLFLCDKIKTKNQEKILELLYIKRCHRTDREYFHFYNEGQTNIHNTCNYCNIVKVATMEDNQLCSICCVDIEKEANAIRLDCGHFYHKTCISNWFIRKITCPYCRRDYTDYTPKPTLTEVFFCKNVIMTKDVPRKACTTGQYVYTPLNVYKVYVDKKHTYYLYEDVPLCVPIMKMK
jgi:hypothetical protein